MTHARNTPRPDTFGMAHALEQISKPPTSDDFAEYLARYSFPPLVDAEKNVAVNCPDLMEVNNG